MPSNEDSEPRGWSPRRRATTIVLVSVLALGLVVLGVDLMRLATVAMEHQETRDLPTSWDAPRGHLGWSGATYDQTPWGTPLVLSYTREQGWRRSLSGLSAQRCQWLLETVPPAWSDVRVNGIQVNASLASPSSLCRQPLNTVVFAPRINEGLPTG